MVFISIDTINFAIIIVMVLTDIRDNVILQYSFSISYNLYQGKKWNILLHSRTLKISTFFCINSTRLIDNVVKNRARIAIDEIVKIAVEKFLETGESIRFKR